MATGEYFTLRARIAACLRAANEGTRWEDVSSALQHAELELHGLRFVRLRALFKRRPVPEAFRARELARLLSSWADELDSPSVAGDRRRALETAVGALMLQASREMNPKLKGTKDETYLRAVLFEIVDEVARLARGEWKTLLPAEPKERWGEMGHEVIRIYGESVEPSRVPLLKRHCVLVGRAVQAASNRGGRGKRAEIPKSQALIELCAAVGFPAPEYDSIRTTKTRKKQR